jgi:hypothetical protein
MFFDYRCTNCTGPWPDNVPKIGSLVIDFVVRTGHGKCPPIGSKTKCPNCGKKTAVRMISSDVSIIIRGQHKVNVNSAQTMRTRVNGQEIKMTFVDHPHTSPEYQRNLASIASRTGVGGDQANVSGLKNAYYSEKHGCVCVDVASDVKDPLGMYEKSKKQGNYSQTTRKINQPFKIRGKK